jgi:phage shock protein C
MKRFEKILHGGLYRSRDGLLLGVCRGIAEYFDFSVFWTRTIVLILLFLSGFWPIMALYFIAALLMKPEPVVPIQSDDQQEFYDSYRKGGMIAWKVAFSEWNTGLRQKNLTGIGD